MARSVATNKLVDRDELERFVRPRHHGILSTERDDGTPQMSPVTMGVDPGGRIVVASYPQRAKAHNLRRRPHAAMCVLSDSFDGEWVQVWGTTEVIDLPDALDGLVEYFRAIAGEHSDWAEYRQAMTDQGKVLIRLQPEGWGPISKGGFPPHLAGG